MKACRVPLYSDNQPSSATIPERSLLAAILDRALRDLAPDIEPAARKSAITWFGTKPNPRKKEFRCITFATVCEHIQFAPWQRDFILEKIEFAVEFEKGRCKSDKAPQSGWLETIKTEAIKIFDFRKRRIRGYG